MKKKIVSPQDILNKLKEYAEREGITIYLVGGYIRDILLRRKSNDIDIVMEADALSFARGFASYYHLPAPVFYGRFGTAMIETSGIKIEFATARKESYPDNSRKPDVQRATIEEDFARRDFTINAIAKNLITGEIIDLFNGREDIKKKIIRTPISPEKTFYDDPLRILRGIRFATRLKFEIENGTLEGMKKNVSRLSIVSIERISEEILKTLEAKEPSRGFYLMDEVGALAIVLPEVSALKEKRTDHPCKELFSHTLQVLDNVSIHTRDVYLKMAALLHDIGKPATLQVGNGKVSFHRHEFVGQKMSYRICRRLNIPEEKGKFIGRMIRYHLRPHLLAKEDPTDSALRRFIKEMGKDIKPLFTLAKADLTSHNITRVKNALEKLTRLEERIKDINKRDRLSSFKLAIDGYAIMKLFEIPEGRKVGEIKQRLESLVLDGVIRNRKREIIRYIKENKETLLKPQSTALHKSSE